MSLDEPNNITLLHSLKSDLPAEINLLLLEDNVVDQEALARTASKTDLRLSLTFCATIGEMTECLAGQAFDVAVLDFQLPDGNGLEAQKLVSQSPLNSECATIMVATEAEITIAVAAMKSGCSDFIAKDDLTPATLRRAIISARQKSELRARVTEAGRKLVSLRAVLREHCEMSKSVIRPLMRRSLAQINALEFANGQAGHAGADVRLDIINENCREVLTLCDSIERDETLVNEGMDLNR